MDIDLDGMDLEALRALRGRVDQAITGFRDRQRRNALDAAEKAAREHGFSSLSELTSSRRRGAAAGTSGKKAKGERTGAETQSEARYRNPEDPAQVWSGRGRRPRWIQDALSSGRDLSEFGV